MRSLGSYMMILALGMTLPPQLTAQSLPTINGVTCEASITSSGDTFTYIYTVSNASSSVGSIWVVDIDISQPVGGIELGAQGLINGPGFAANSSSSILVQPQTIAMVPVGVQSPPSWVSGLTTSGRVQWGASSDTSVIGPGQLVMGYQLSSFGLPGIRAFTVEPFLDIDTLPITPPANPADLQRYQNELASIRAQVAARGSTVGPTAPPANFDPVQFLQTIKGYKEKAVEQGWIDNSGVANSLDVKLNAALIASEQQDMTTLKTVLNALLNEVSAQAGKHLTPEAIALLRFNTEYLVSRLP